MPWLNDSNYNYYSEISNFMQFLTHDHLFKKH